MFLDANRVRPLFAAVLLWNATLANAAPAAAPILIEADRAELDQNQLQSTYTGNVRITQGTTVFTGERVTVLHDPDGVPRRVDIAGTPARFSQPAEAKTPAIDARAERMRYDAESGQLELNGSAWIRQNRDEVSGERLIYDRVNQRILATGEAGGTDRVRITIQPRTSQDDATP